VPRCAVYDAGGTVVSCGLSDYGQLGDGVSGRSPMTGTPVAVSGLPAGRIVALTSSYGDRAISASNTEQDPSIDSRPAMFG
jgi:hypothetical protein